MPNKIFSAFDEIKADEKLKINTKECIKRKIQKQSEGETQRLKKFQYVNKRSLKYVAVILCLLIFLGGGNIVYHMEKDAVTYISIDVNPSIELALNKFDKVISVKAYNEDGKKVLENLNIEGKDYEDAINIIVESKSMSGYLTENEALTFTVASKYKNKESEIVENINNCNSCKKHKGISIEADMDKIKEAHDYGLSFGKYMAYLELKKYTDSVTTDDCKNMTMRDIRNLISQYSESEDDNKSYQKENGNCSGNNNSNGSNCKNMDKKCS